MLKEKRDTIILNVIAFTVLGLLALAAFLPFAMLVLNSFQSEDALLRNGYALIPKEFSTRAYEVIFSKPDKILRSYGLTIFITVVGTVVSLFFSSMTAYVLARKDVKYRNPMAFFLFFTTLFNAGLAPNYLLMTKYLHLRDTVLVLVLVNMFNVTYILILRNNVANTIPDTISESAKIDGANDFVIFIRIILPLMKTALASIGLFIALGYWNDWWTAMLYIQDQRLFPLQYMLYQLLSYSSYMTSLLSSAGVTSAISMPTETLKLALTVVATGPIVLAYPFAQKHFTKGITVGAVKG